MANLQRHVEGLQGKARPDGEALTDRIVQTVADVGEVEPTRLGELLALEDPTVNTALVRSLLGQLVAAGRLQKLGCGRYALLE